MRGSRATGNWSVVQQAQHLLESYHDSLSHGNCAPFLIMIKEKMNELNLANQVRDSEVAHRWNVISLALEWLPIDYPKVFEPDISGEQRLQCNALSIQSWKRCLEVANNTENCFEKADYANRGLYRLSKNPKYLSDAAMKRMQMHRQRSQPHSESDFKQAVDLWRHALYAYREAYLKRELAVTWEIFSKTTLICAESTNLPAHWKYAADTFFTYAQQSGDLLCWKQSENCLRRVYQLTEDPDVARQIRKISEWIESRIVKHVCVRKENDTAMQWRYEPYNCFWKPALLNEQETHNLAPVAVDSCN